MRFSGECPSCTGSILSTLGREGGGEPLQSVTIESIRPQAGVWLRVVPTAVLIGCAWALAWETGGSIDVSDWAPYAAGSCFVLAAILLAGAASMPSWAALGAGGLLLGLAVWTAVSLDWSSAPSAARDDALLAAFYVVAYAIPLVTLRSDGDRKAAATVVVYGLGLLAVAGAVELWTTAHPENFYDSGRMAFPITYPNALAGMLLVGFWPAIALAAERRLPAILRAGSLAAAVALVADLLLAQSKGGAIALGVSGVVLLAVSPARLRALVPAAIVAILIGIEARALTRPYRVSDEQLNAAISHGGAVAAVLSAIAVAVGLLYALLDQRIRVPDRVRRGIGIAVAIGAIAVALGGIGAFFATVHRPEHFFAQRWRSFRHLPAQRTGSSHFFTLGSNRYDFWRVAFKEFEHHPLAGIGARGFEADYLVHGRSSETPARSHSVEMDALGELGIVGFLLLAGAGVLGFVALWRGARVSLLGAGLLAAGAYFAVHTAVDWIWTIPAVGVPAFALFGIGASTGSGRLLPARAAVPAGVVALVLAIAGFAPPWLSARFIDRAYQADTAQAAASDLRWARRLDPLATEPYLAQAELAQPPADVPPLERAVAKEPRQEELRYLLGVAYLRAGRKADARVQLREALRLYPYDDLAKEALDRAR